MAFRSSQSERILFLPYSESCASEEKNELYGTNFSASCEASEFCWQIAHCILQHLRLCHMQISNSKWRCNQQMTEVTSDHMLARNEFFFIVESLQWKWILLLYFLTLIIRNCPKIFATTCLLQNGIKIIATFKFDWW